MLLAFAALSVAGSARARADDFWASPIARAAAYVEAVQEDDRPYSTLYRPRDIAGDVATSCEHQEGRPCGKGVATFGELDSAAGYRDIVDAALRLRVVDGDGGFHRSYDTGIALDRAHVDASFGPVDVEVGRDALILGPRAHTQLAWGDNAPPLDQMRIGVRPVPIAGDVHGEILYVVGRFHDPQTYSGDLVSIARAQLDIGDRARLGLLQMVQDEGDGAPHLGFWDFLLENVHRADNTASSTDSSNRRFGGDANLRIDGFGGGRIYYQLVFEDIRAKYWDDALRDDADHLFGVELPAFHGLTVELEKTGFRSQEHIPRVTGFTSGARAVGSPLGSGAQALYVATAPWSSLHVAPWLELVRLGSDKFHQITHGPIVHDTYGVTEARARAGASATWPLAMHAWLDANAFVEHVGNAAYVAGAQRENAGITVAVVWQP